MSPFESPYAFGQEAFKVNCPEMSVLVELEGKKLKNPYQLFRLHGDFGWCGKTESKYISVGSGMFNFAPNLLQEGQKRKLESLSRKSMARGIRIWDKVVFD